MFRGSLNAVRVFDISAYFGYYGYNVQYKVSTV